MPFSIAAIVPVFNTEKYLREAIDSLLAQTIPFDEIIIINDGSTDSCPLILEEYQNSNKIILINQSNQGQGIARNLGIAKARSEFLYFFDSDDIAYPSLVATIQQQLVNSPDLELIAFAGTTFFDIECISHKFTPKYDRAFPGKYAQLFNAAIKLDTMQLNHCSPCLYLIKKEIILKNSLQFCSYFHEDEAFMLDLIANVGSCLILEDFLFHRRIRENSTMTSPKSERHIKGYLHASTIAKKYNLILELSQKKYFKNQSLHFYFCALSVSFATDSDKQFNTLYKRLAGLPTWRITPKQIIILFLGRKTLLIREIIEKLKSANQIFKFY